MAEAREGRQNLVPPLVSIIYLFLSICPSLYLFTYRLSTYHLSIYLLSSIIYHLPISIYLPIIYLPTIYP